MRFAALAGAALLLEALIGYPERLDRRLPHPVNLLGLAINRLERRWNQPLGDEEGSRRRGVLALVLTAGGAGLAGAGIQRVLRGRRDGDLPLVLMATLGLAQRSLDTHVRAVLHLLEAGDLEGARTAVGRIVGRDTAGLDASGVAAAALESLAESFNDGVVAPALWLASGGLGALYAYKAVNTADSLVGHREPRWRSYGWASARTDDLMNLAPARLSGVLLALAGRGGLRVMIRDAPRHASPNAGWPEAAMAGALRCELGGPATYEGVLLERPRFGAGPRPGAAELRRGLAIYRRACALLILALGALAWRR